MGINARIELDEQLKAAKEDFEMARAEAMEKAKEELKEPLLSPFKASF